MQCITVFTLQQVKVCMSVICPNPLPSPSPILAAMEPSFPRKAFRSNLCPTFAINITIELTVHTSCYCILDLLCITSFNKKQMYTTNSVYLVSQNADISLILTYIILEIKFTRPKLAQMAFAKGMENTKGRCDYRSRRNRDLPVR